MPCKLLPAVFFLLFPAVCLFAQHPNRMQQISYDLRSTLDDRLNALEGQVRIRYSNTSPDTLPFIWINVWPNAFKNDRTAFTDQSLAFDSTAFYFSRPNQRGYINRLQFTVNQVPARMEDHPQHQDLLKIYLPVPLPPGGSCTIETPFYVKIPANRAGIGVAGGRYTMAHWYPSVAVYDEKGWHPAPLLMTGNTYLPFADFRVRINVPAAYTVVGSLADSVHVVSDEKAAATPLKSYTFFSRDVTSFSWAAAKDFQQFSDTISMPGKGKLHLHAFVLPGEEKNAARLLHVLRNSMLHHVSFIGNYPGNSFSLVSTPVMGSGNCAFPGLILFTASRNGAVDSIRISEYAARAMINAVVSVNEPEAPQIVNGFSAFLAGVGKPETPTMFSDAPFLRKHSGRLPINQRLFAEQFLENDRRLPSADFPEAAYYSVGSYDASTAVKSARYWENIEMKEGPGFAQKMRGSFDRVRMRITGVDLFEEYSRIEGGNSGINGSFTIEQAQEGADVLKSGKTDTPGKIVTEHIVGPTSGKEAFPSSGRNNQGDVNGQREGKVRFEPLFNLRNPNNGRTFYYAPVAGYNQYDGVMLGALLHNHSLPQKGFRFALAPVFAFGSTSLNGIGDLRYRLPSGPGGRHWEFSLTGAGFHGDAFTDSSGKMTRLRFSRLVPSVRYVFGRTLSGNPATVWLQWKTFLIGEQSVDFNRDTVNNLDLISYPTRSRYVNRLELVIENRRALYPFRYALQADQGSRFLRLAFTGNYFFNYAAGDGLRLRCFAGKFFHLGSKTLLERLETDFYQLNMTGPRGYEDYTYENYFVGRGAFEGYAAQQIMNRDGFFKVRTDLLSDKVGKSDNWLAALNLVTPLPRSVNPLSVLPVKIPLRLFLDVGTSAENWRSDATTGRFLFDAGLQVSLFRDVLNIYMPLLYSKVYRDYFKSTIPSPRFLRNISFSIDLQRLNTGVLPPPFSF